MARRVNQVQSIFLPIELIVHLDSMGLDGNPLFTLQIHVIQHLGVHLAAVEGAGKFQKPICQRTFSVINMSDNAKVASVLHSRDSVQILRGQR